MRQSGHGTSFICLCDFLKHALTIFEPLEVSSVACLVGRQGLPARRVRYWDLSSVGLERMLDRHEVGGSNPPGPTLAGGEHRLDRAGVAGSKPTKGRFTRGSVVWLSVWVLEFFNDISKGKHELIAVYASEMKLTEAQVQERAKETLTHLLHHYGFFSISTIDTFFHRVIRAFSREIGLQGSFGIELDTDKVAEYIASDIFTDIEDPQLKEWLVPLLALSLTTVESFN